MKKILLIAMMFIPIICLSQTKTNFEIQPNGTFLNMPDSASFLVFKKDGQTAKQLYDKIYLAVTKAYTSPKDVISKIDNEIISINGIVPNFQEDWMLGICTVFGMQYKIQFQFKDGKIRIDAPIILAILIDNNPWGVNNFIENFKIFKKGKPNKSKMDKINGINKSINDILNNILKEDKTDW